MSDNKVEDQVSSCLTKENEKPMLERYLDKFYEHLDKELSYLSSLYGSRAQNNSVDHTEFVKARERVSILIKTMSELHVLEHSSSDYLGITHIKP